MTVHRHHVDGRPVPGGPYIDTDLTIDLSPVDHRLLHLVLSDLGCEWPAEGEPLLVHRVRRHVVTFGAAADAGRPVMFNGLAVRAEWRLWLAVLDALGGGS